MIQNLYWSDCVSTGHQIVQSTKTVTSLIQHLMVQPTVTCSALFQSPLVIDMFAQQVRPNETLIDSLLILRVNARQAMDDLASAKRDEKTTDYALIPPANGRAKILHEPAKEA